MDLSVPIPGDEWRVATRFPAFTTYDESEPLGQIRVVGDGRQRKWYASDGVSAIVVDGGAGNETFDICISPVLAMFAVADRPTGDVPLHIRSSDTGRRYGVTTTIGDLWLDDYGYDYPDVDAEIPTGDDVMACATASALAIREAIVTNLHPRWPRDDENDRPFGASFWIQIDGSTIRIAADWGDKGLSEIALHATDARGEGAVEVNPHPLQHLVEMFSPSEDVQLVIPTLNTLPISLSTHGKIGLLMPFETVARTARRTVESVIQDVCGRLATVRDHEGRYPLRRHSTKIYGRLLADSEPLVFQVFSVIVSDIAESAELLRELNDLNANVQFARFTHAQDQIRVEVDLVAQVLDRSELEVALDRITDIANRTMPTLSAVLGGRMNPDPLLVRYDKYRQTIVDAEVSPGNWVALNGPDGVDEWPFPTAVHVLTGWNPQGVALLESEQRTINAQIAQDIVRKEGKFVHGSGRSATGDHDEPSLVAWGLTRAAALSMGSKANQDAIFEITPDEVYLLSCSSDHIESWPRVVRTTEASTN